MKPLIQLEHVHTVIGDKKIHEDINLAIYAGEVVALVGASGCGKTTLLRNMMQLEKPAKGTITSAFSKKDFHRAIGMMFQQGALFGGMTLLENVAFPLQIHTQLSDNFIEAIAKIKIQWVGLPQDAYIKYPNELSGGMIKRAAVARALALDPPLLLLDEPTAGLDPHSAYALIELILQLKKILALTLVIVTHDLIAIEMLANRIVFLGDKKILAIGDFNELKQSTDPRIRDFFTSGETHVQ